MTAAAVRVVVCDDVPELRRLMRHGLEEEGDLDLGTVHTALREATRRRASSPPD